MKTIINSLLSACLGASAAMSWNGPTPIHQLGGQCGTEPVCLGTASVVRQTVGSDWGPQALEGYTIIDTRSKVRLAIGTIGNIEQAGSGDVAEARSMQAGGVINGSGRIGRWTGVFIDRPKIMGTGAAVSPEQMPDYRAIQFDNGLYLTTGVDPRDGKPYLALCPDDPRSGPCQMFKP